MKAKQSVLKNVTEDFGADYAGLGLDTAMGGMPYGGAHYGSSDRLYQIFVKPFADVVGVAAGKTKELARKGLTAIKVAFEAIATTLVPILKDSYDEIFQQEKEDLQKIKAEYADIYGATWKAFTHPDVTVAAFMFRPDLFVTAKFVRQSPKAAAKILSVLSGGALDKALNKILSHGEKHKSKHESVLREAEKKKSPVDQLVDLATSQEAREIMQKTPIVQKMSNQGHDLVKQTLTDVLTQASTLLSAKSLDDVQKQIGEKLKGIDELKKVPQQERQKAESDLLDSVKAGMKAFYIEQLKNIVKKAIEGGVAQDHPFVKAYNNAITKIAAM